jgi:leucyl/phenylalanyl-tRNA--protein transferase
VPVYRIPSHLWFPDPATAESNGLLGVGGDVSPDRLMLGYRRGIFPWYSLGQPVLWFSPDPRMILETADLVVARSLAKRIRQRRFRITLDTAFLQVLVGCAATSRPGQDGTWLTPALIAGLLALHEQGLAHSVEAWLGDDLVGGLYGVAIGRLFSGESMFAAEPDASKVAFVHLVRQLEIWGFPRVDCQSHTQHLARFGAIEIARERYLRELPALVGAPGRPGPWAFDAGFTCDG